MEQLQDRFPVLWLVKKLQVAHSGYYSWLQMQSNPGKRAKQDEEIAADIEVVFKPVAAAMYRHVFIRNYVVTAAI